MRRNKVRMATRVLLMDHCFNKHLHTIGVLDDPIFRACYEDDENMRLIIEPEMYDVKISRSPQRRKDVTFLAVKKDSEWTCDDNSAQPSEFIKLRDSLLRFQYGDYR